MPWNWAQSSRGLWSLLGTQQEMSTCPCQEKLKTRLEMWLWHCIHSSLPGIRKHSARSVRTVACGMLGTRVAIRQPGAGVWKWEQSQLHQNKLTGTKQKKKKTKNPAFLFPVSSDHPSPVSLSLSRLVIWRCECSILLGMLGQHRNSPLLARITLQP